MEARQVVLSKNEVAEEMLIDDLKIVQDTRLYRFTSDSVMLSRFAKAKKGDVIADFCAGCGIVAFHFYALNKTKYKTSPKFVLFEMQDELLGLAKKTAKLNNFTNFDFQLGKLQEISATYRGAFSLVLCNPPYEKANTGFENNDYKKAVCRKEITLNLEEIAKSAEFVLKFGGRLCLLHRADRLAEVCYTLKQYRLEVKKIQFVKGKTDEKPYLVMVEAVKGGKPSTQILPTVCNEG